MCPVESKVEIYSERTSPGTISHSLFPFFSFLRSRTLAFTLLFRSLQRQLATKTTFDRLTTATTHNYHICKKHRNRDGMRKGEVRDQERKRRENQEPEGKKGTEKREGREIRKRLDLTANRVQEERK